MKKIVTTTLALLLVLLSAYAQQWVSTNVGEGSLPDIEIDSNNKPHIAFARAAGLGQIYYTPIEGGQAGNTEIAFTGSVSGPLDLEFSPQDQPYISFLNVTVDVDARIAFRGVTEWGDLVIMHDDLDGFDASMIFVNNEIYLSYIDPEDNVELATYTPGGNVNVELIESNNSFIQNDYGTALADNSAGEVFVSYFTLEDSTLRLAEKIDNLWQNSRIDDHASNPDMVIDAAGNIHVAYYQVSLDSGQYDNNGIIKLATRSGGMWSYQVIDSINGIDLAINDGGAIGFIDVEMDSQGILHIAYASKNDLNLATITDGSITIQNVASMATGTELGQSVGLAVDNNDDLHIAYYTVSGDNNEVYYATFVEGSLFTLTCPPDTTLSCGSRIDTSITGTAVVMGTATLSYEDTEISTCPTDQQISRMWIADDGTNADTCIQMIRVLADTLASRQRPTMALFGQCVEDVQAMISDSIDLPCGAAVSDIGFEMISMNCDTASFQKSWLIVDSCRMDTVLYTQLILAMEIPWFEAMDTSIIGTFDSTGSASFGFRCEVDSLSSYLWSNGDSAAMLSGAAPGDYSLIAINSLGCENVLNVTIPDSAAQFQIICPPDTLLSCGDFITPDITGFPTYMGYDTVMMVDENIQECPDDIIIRRAWIGSVGGMSGDTCFQMITYQVDTTDIILTDSLFYENICMDNLGSILESAINASCQTAVAETRYDTLEYSCDTVRFMVHYQLEKTCLMDSLIDSQYVEIIHPIFFQIDGENISYDTNTGLATLTLNSLCTSDDLSYVWSDSSTMPLLMDVEAGEYDLVISNSIGCQDTFTFIILPIVIDTVDRSLICAEDITISCTSSIGPESTGFPTQMGYDSINYQDVVLADSCLTSMIISRTWIAYSNIENDSCQQLITVLRDGIDVVNIDTLVYEGICEDEVAGALMADIPELSCGVSIDSISLSEGVVDGNELIFMRTFSLRDSCAGRDTQLVQAIILRNIVLFKIENIEISSDNGDSSGAIDFDIVCAPDSVRFLWSDGSTDTLLTGVEGGSYQLVVTDSITSLMDTFDFFIPTVLDTNMVIITCPDDVTIGCDSSIDPEETGRPVVSASDTIYYVDMVVDSCPADMIIARQWISTLGDDSDTCVQTITIERADIADFLPTDIIRMTGLCFEEVGLFLDDPQLSLSCGLVLDTVLISQPVDSVLQYIRTWIVSDTCRNVRDTVLQTILFDSISTVKISNVVITPDDGTGSGAISYDIICAPDSIGFEWSNGSTDTLLFQAEAGDYELTITDRIDSSEYIFNFAIPLMIDTSLIHINCPPDTVLSCSDGTLPEVAGMPTSFGFDTLFYIDTVTDTCPGDMIIERDWIGQGSIVNDTCTQVITVLRDGLEKLEIASQVSMTGLCNSEIEDLLSDESLPLNPCDIEVDSVIIVADSTFQDFRSFTRTFYVSDQCLSRDTSLSQMLVFNDIAVLRMDNIVIGEDQGDSTGFVTFDVICSADSTSFVWSNGATDTTLQQVPAGNYDLVVRSSDGLVDTFNFVVPLADTTNYVFDCPADTILSCSVGEYQSELTGIAIQSGYDTLTYFDVVRDSCPGDLIIERVWVAMSQNRTDSCIQQITIESDGLSFIDVERSLQLRGVCLDELSDPSSFANSLTCGVTVDSLTIDITSQSCEQIDLVRSVRFYDSCRDSAMTIEQNITLLDIPVIKILEQNVVTDNGTGTGAVQLDIDSCGQDISYQWSNGDSIPSLSNIAGGDYQLVVSNTDGCVDTFDFTIPIIDTSLITLRVRDRGNMAFALDSIRMMRSNGVDIHATIAEIETGSYTISSPSQSIIRGDLICMYSDDSPARDVSALDIIKSRLHILGLDLACDDDQIAADVNFDGNITGGDLAAMTRVILNIDSTFVENNNISWTYITGTETNVNLRALGCIEITDEHLSTRNIEVKAIKLGDLLCEPMGDR